MNKKNVQFMSSSKIGGETEGTVAIAWINYFQSRFEAVDVDRIRAFEKICIGVNPNINLSMTRTRLEKLKHHATSMNKVTLMECDADSSPQWLSPVGGTAAGRRDDGAGEVKSLRIFCTCEEFFRANICPCCVAVITSNKIQKTLQKYKIEAIDLDTLLTSTAPSKRAAGRPRKQDVGSRYGSSSASSSSSS